MKTAKIGQAPGTPLYTGRFTATKTEQHHYNAQQKQWLLVTGLADIEAIQDICSQHHIHNLVLEDILHVHQRPRAENLDGTLFMSLDYLSLQKGSLQREQISLWWQGETVITFCEQPDHPFQSVIKRLDNPEGRLQRLGPNYLVYCLLDQIIDQYFVVLNHFEEQLELVNQSLIDDEKHDRLKELHQLKTQLLTVRKSLSPLNELVLPLKEMFTGKDRVYWQDLKDHSLQAQEGAKAHLEIADSLFNLYFSLVGLRTNRIMQSLTVITLIFLPLTLIAGIYGMNFKYMPELDWSYGYPLVIGGMGLVSILILWYFKRKHWF